MRLLEHRTNIHGAVNIRAVGIIAPNRAVRVPFQKRAKPCNITIRLPLITCCVECPQTPSAIGRKGVAKLNWFRVAQPFDRRRVEPHTYLETRRQILMIGAAGDQRRVIAPTTKGVHPPY